jgi:hypothetical protein
MRRDGKAAKRAGKSEDLPARKTTTFEDEVGRRDLEDKRGKSPDRFIRSGDFFIPHLKRIENLMKGGMKR